MRVLLILLVGSVAHAQLPGTKGEATIEAPEAKAYSYELPDEKGFLELRRQALESLKKHGAPGEKLAAYYEKEFFQKLPKKLDAKSVDFARAVLAYKKALKFSQTNRLKELGYRRTSNGRHNENSPILGTKADVMRRFLEFGKKNGAVARFANALYGDNPNCPGEAAPKSDKKGDEADEEGPATMTLIPDGLRGSAENPAKETLRAFLNALPSQDGAPLTADEAGVKSDGGRAGVTYLYDVSTPTTDWTTHVVYNEGGAFHTCGGKRYWLPGSMILLHELAHVERTFPGEQDFWPPGSPFRATLVEVGPSLEHMIATRSVLQKLDPKAEFPGTIPTGKAPKGAPAPRLSVDRVVTTLRALMAKLAVKTPEEALMSDEGLKFASTYFDNAACSVEDGKRARPEFHRSTPSRQNVPEPGAPPRGNEHGTQNN